MIDLESETPVFFWTLNELFDYEQDEDLWKADPLGDPIITNEGIVFDYPGDWEPRCNTTRFDLEPDGYYHFRSSSEHYWGIRSDSHTHVILTGLWSETDFGKGVFIAVLPRK